MSKLVLEQTLIEVEPFEGVLGGVGELFKELLGNHARFSLLLKEAEDLVDFIGNDVSILVFLVFGGNFSSPFCLRVVFPVFIHLYFLAFSLIRLSNILFFI
jgi:hypothetical protein